MKAIPCSILAALLVSVSSCTVFNPGVANVGMPSSGDTVEVKVTSRRGDDHSQRGVRHLAAKDWQLALDEFKQTLANHPKDHGTFFALGVAYEQLGQLDKALEHYKKANVNKLGGEADPQYVAGIKRIENKLKGVR